MEPIKNFEHANARQWAEESNGAGQTQPRIGQPAVANPNVSPNRPVYLGQQTPRRGNQLPFNQRPQNTVASGSRAASSPRRLGEKPKATFAKAAGLETTRKTLTKQINADQEAIEKKYMQDPAEDVYIVATGFYLWPDKLQTPMQLLGLRMEDLDHLRKQFNLYIQWDSESRSLVISSEHQPNAKENVIEAIKGIRQAYQNVKARNISVMPIFLVAPPTAEAIRQIVRPNRQREGFTVIELAGDRLLRKDMLVWKLTRKKLEENNYTKLQSHLAKHLLALAPMKGWMRMRVHFGHLNLTQYPKIFSQSQCSFDKFFEILELPRAQAAAKFDKKLPDPTAALTLKAQIVNMPSQFCPTEGPTFPLTGVKFQDTLCLFFKDPQGIPIRVESEIDRNIYGEYQIGATNAFRDNRRNKHIEIIIIDIERKVDCALEVITDNRIQKLAPSWQTLVASSITPNASERTDSLGLPYPAVSLQGGWDIKVDTVVLRSTIRFKVLESDYMVEIAIYRQWCGRNTVYEPEVQTSVTMFHPYWDTEMESLENTTRVRSWDAQLGQLFNNGTEKTHGFQDFVGHVKLIQGYLSEASREFFESLVGA